MDVVVAAAVSVGFDCAVTGTDDRWINGPCHGRGSLLVLVYAFVSAVLPYTPCLIRRAVLFLATH